VYMKTIIFCIVTFFGVLQSSPKVVAKFGQSQCPWSEQLKQEVWTSSIFQALLEDAGIEREEREASEKDENVPILILFTSSGEEIGSIGHLLISPEKYVDLLKEMLTIHTLCQSLTHLNIQQLLQLYRKSQVLHMISCSDKLLQEGLTKDAGVEFLIEHYAKIVKEHPRRAQKIKQEIRMRKPHDSATEWELALLSFQARREKMEEESKVVLPLKKFLRDYGSKDQDYVWRCHLVLAEFYRDKNRLDKAKHHAKLAADGAPSELKGMIIAIGDEAG
ncbi:MAG: hypothetical protein ACRDFB_05590, partial [Rhabdochlamydiaceae bacterium]